MARTDVDPILTDTSPSPAGAATLGAMIREARERLGLSPTDLGVRLGIQNRRAAYRRVRSWETGEGSPSREYVIAIAKVLDVDLRDWAGALAGEEPRGEGWAKFREQHAELFASKSKADIDTVRYLRSLWLPDGVIPRAEWYEAQLTLYRLLPR